MRFRSLNSSRSAYLFVTINLVLLLVFLIIGSSNLTGVQLTQSNFDHMLHDWFRLRLQIERLGNTDPKTIAELAGYSRFYERFEEAEVDPSIVAAMQLSESLDLSLRRALDAWHELSGLVSADTSPETNTAEERITRLNTVMDRFQTSLDNAQVYISRFVDTQERALSVLIYCLAATILLIAVVFVLVEVENRRTRRQALQTVLLARNTIRAQEAERARIARGLHDSLAQELSLATMETDLLAGAARQAGGDAVRNWAQLSTRLRAAIDWVRHMAYELRPAEIDAAGLAAAITSYCEERSRNSGLSIRWNIDGGVDAVSNDTAINLYRIIQEAITNASRHANASELAVDLRIREANVILSIKDDGMGIRRSQERKGGTRHGLGIAGMEERARMIGASIELHDEYPGGTTVRLQMPVSEDPRAEGDED